MAMEPEREPLGGGFQHDDHEESITFSSSTMVNNDANINVFALKTKDSEELAFINVSGGNLDDPTSEHKDGSTLSGTPANMMQRAQASWESFKSFKKSATADLAPWTAFADRSKFSVPTKTQIFGRIRTNLKLYYANYMALLGALAAWIMIQNLMFVFAMLLSVGCYYYYRIMTSDGSGFVFRGRSVSPAQFYMFLISFTLFLFWLTGGGSTMFWMIASALIVVIGHASFREANVDPNANADVAFDALQHTLAAHV